MRGLRSGRTVATWRHRRIGARRQRLTCDRPRLPARWTPWMRGPRLHRVRCPGGRRSDPRGCPPMLPHDPCCIRRPATTSGWLGTPLARVVSLGDSSTGPDVGHGDPQGREPAVSRHRRRGSDPTALPVTPLHQPARPSPAASGGRQATLTRSRPRTPHPMRTMKGPRGTAAGPKVIDVHVWNRNKQLVFGSRRSACRGRL